LYTRIEKNTDRMSRFRVPFYLCIQNIDTKVHLPAKENPNA
jgi:hypothetical protein